MPDGYGTMKTIRKHYGALWIGFRNWWRNNPKVYYLCVVLPMIVLGLVLDFKSAPIRNEGLTFLNKMSLRFLSSSPSKPSQKKPSKTTLRTRDCTQSADGVDYAT